MKISRFASRFDIDSGIVQLMDDLGNAMSKNKNVLMMGGGNPSHIPEVQSFFHDKMQRVLDQPAEFAHMIGDYDSPQGDKPFLDAIAELLNKENGWDINSNNVALTAGSQAGFFYFLTFLLVSVLMELKGKYYYLWHQNTLAIVM